MNRNDLELLVLNTFFLDPLEPGDEPHRELEERLFQYLHVGYIEDFSVIPYSLDHLQAAIKWEQDEGFTFYNVHYILLPSFE